MGTGKWVKVFERLPSILNMHYVCARNDGAIFSSYYGFCIRTNNHEFSTGNPDYWLDPPDLPEPEMDLLPCPNPECGEFHHLLWANNSASFWALCQRCGMTGPKKGDRDAAYKAWNNLPR